MKNCPYCNAEIDDSSLFCGICGKKLPANQFCVKCGNKRNGIEKFCPKCGTPYDSSQEPTDDSPKETRHNSKSKSSLRIAAVIGLIIVLLGGCLWYFALRKDYSLEGLAKAVQKYEIICNFKDGLAEVCKDGKWGFIDKNGNEVIPCKYDPIEDSDNGFFEGLAVVITNNYEKFHVINKKGDIAFTHSYSWVNKFSEGLSVVNKNNKMGYIDTNGKEVIPCTYDLAYEFSEGMAIVYKGNKYGFIDTKGNVVIPFEYETDEEIPTGFHDGLACVYKNGKYGYIDKKGNVVVPYKYDIAYPFSEGMAVVAKKVASDVYKYGYIDTSGNEVIKCEYRDANSFSEGYASVKKVADYMFIDKSGKEMISCTYYNVGSFHEGLARVTTKNDDDFLSGFIDKSGNEIIPCIYDCYEDFSEGLVVVSKDGVQGYVDRKGNSTFDFQNGDVNEAANEKKQREEEEERKRQEEDNKPQNKFYTIASQDYCWVGQGFFEGADTYGFGEYRNHKVYLFFYPQDKNSGEVLVKDWYDPRQYFTTRQAKVKYRFVNENTITFQFRMSWYASGEFSDISFTLTVINDGDNIKLLRYDGNEYVQQRAETKEFDYKFSSM